DETLLDRIRDPGEDDRPGRLVAKRGKRHDADCHDDLGRRGEQLFPQRGRPGGIDTAKTIIDGEVLPQSPPEFLETLLKAVVVGLHIGILGLADQDGDAPGTPVLLRASGERMCANGRNPSRQRRYEVASFHILSSFLREKFRPAMRVVDYR